ncbi:MAG: hypothetical protein J7463_16860 [Roseiflexus sp.]|jgi:hypothetical protein|nr:hypothetical protein [Roseiflexus sp.]MBO9334912.1 hypothetical protein [Roseiflexus sp.]MBO9365088.1 hypothetical protein [Roseiflexus sp.]MBO9381536.1 hypothetical protein [Roseiflexus sp.]
MNYLTLNRIAILALVACVALLLFAQPQPLVLSRWSPVSPSVPTIGAVAVPVADVSPLNIVVNEGLYVDERDRLDQDARRAYAYVAARFGSELMSPLTVAFIQDAGCALSGIAYTDIRRVQVFTCNAIGRERAIAILAHEYVHQLQQDRYGSRHLSADLILSEGMATWGAGIYWLGEYPDFRRYVRAQRTNGISYPLATHYAGRGVAVMNALYYQWASFVEFLIDQYGRERLDAVYVTGAGTPGSADYRAVYGKDLATLEQEWIAWLEAAP